VQHPGGSVIPPVSPSTTHVAAVNRTLTAALIEATKPRITRLVTITAGVGFAMAGVSRSWRLDELLITGGACVVGTALSAAGANAINQWMEQDRDALMVRTCGRPLPTRRATPTAVLAVGLALGFLGVLTLATLCGIVPAIISLACLLTYTLAYTPLKPITHFATHVGTIPGALPPLIGWTAASASGGLASLAHPGGWSLFLLMTVWQMPHFLAIAWMYRDDYAKGGYRVLPVLPDGERRTATSIAVWSVLLVPATIAPAWAAAWTAADTGTETVWGGWGRIAWVYAVVAAIGGVVMLRLASSLAKQRTRHAARRLFLASIMHLPLLLVVLVAEALVKRFIA
jgi:heme o synthase